MIPIEIAWTRVKGKMNPGWKDIYYNVRKPANVKLVQIVLYGQAATIPPRWYMVWSNNSIDDKMGQNVKYLECRFEALMIQLDTYLNNECNCVPAADGSIGGHCDYHKKIYGY